MRKLTSLIIMLLAIICIVSAQESVKIHGVVRDSKNTEIVREAKITIKGKEIPIQLDEKGTYKITLPEGNHIIKFQAPGYKTKTLIIEVYSDTELNIELEKIQNSPTSRA